MTSKTVLSAAALVIVAIAGGCTTFNERTTIGQATSIQTFSETAPDASVVMTDDAPSISSLDRNNWNTQTVLVPVDGSGHQPLYRKDYSEVRFTNRQKGIFPTAESALDLDGKPGRAILGEEVAESGGAPLVAMLDLITMPVRIIINPPTNLARSPSWNYQRWLTPGSPAATTNMPSCCTPATAAPEAAAAQPGVVTQ